ncbi:MAG: adenylate/guanylate cyclase domain-containing protein, partial [Spirochaeta sp.]
MPSSNEPHDNFLRDGERRTVTILFSDMQGFSELSEHMDPEEIDSIMNTVFDAYREIVERQEGTVEKYIGDALVAVFGVPRIHGDDPQRAVHTALDFLDEIAKLNSELSKRNLQLQFRTGIHTGLITTGHRGEHRVVTGHAMSIASRLESHAPPNGILVSIETKEQCENDFVFSSPAKYAIKGSRQPITAFKVLSRAAQPYPSE